MLLVAEHQIARAVGGVALDDDELDVETIDRFGEELIHGVIENIAEGPDADRIMNKTVADGNKFLVAGSFGYQNGALQIARRDPSVTVLHASGFQVAPQ